MNINCPPEPIPTPAARELLIVDDDARIRRFIATWAERQFRVSCACDAFEAIGLLNQRHFDVVLTDFRMPGMNGLELAKWIQTYRPEIPVCMMTSDAFSAEFCATIAPSVDGWLAKPFPLAALGECLNHIISQRTATVGAEPFS